MAVGDAAISGKRIMVIEDDFLIALDLVHQLQSLGAEVVGPFHNVAAALDGLTVRRLDAAVLDVQLGRETVFRLAERLQEASVPFVFATGFDDAVIPEHFASVRRLTKPVMEKDLLGALTDLLPG